LAEEIVDSLVVDTDLVELASFQHLVDEVWVVFVADTELFEDNLFASLVILGFLLVGGFAFFVEALGVKFDVFGTVDGTRTNVFHEGSVSALGSLLSVSSFALDSALGFHHFGSCLADSSDEWTRGLFAFLVISQFISLLSFGVGRSGRMRVIEVLVLVGERLRKVGGGSVVGGWSAELRLEQLGWNNAGLSVLLGRSISCGGCNLDELWVGRK